MQVSLPELYIGVDIGGTKCAVVLGNIQGEILGRISRPTSSGLDKWPAAGDILKSMIVDLCREAKIALQSVSSIGVSCGGPLNSRTGEILKPPNLPGWIDIPLGQILQDAFPGMAVAVENDANATAVAELHWGAGNGFKDFAYLTCGTGMGAGIVLNGAILRGKSDLAGEIGHAVVLPGGPICLCGKRGCLEALASGGAIGRIGAQKLGNPAFTGKDVIELANSGNEQAAQILRDAAYYLGIGIGNLLQTLNLERIILGSLAVYAGEAYLSQVISAVSENTWPEILKDCQIVRSGLGNRTQDLAALAVAIPMVHFLHNRE